MKRAVPLRRGKGLKRTPWNKSVPAGPRLRVPVRRKPKHAPARDTGPDKATRSLVLRRDGYACVRCGASVIGRPYSLQHRRRRSQGGGNSASNLIVLCGTATTPDCHRAVDSRRDPHDEAKGYTVRSWQDPVLMPVMLFSSGGSGITVWLTDAGRYSTDDPALEATA